MVFSLPSIGSPLTKCGRTTRVFDSAMPVTFDLKDVRVTSINREVMGRFWGVVSIVAKSVGFSVR